MINILPSRKVGDKESSLHFKGRREMSFKTRVKKKQIAAELFLFQIYKSRLGNCHGEIFKVRFTKSLPLKTALKK